MFLEKDLYVKILDSIPVVTVDIAIFDNKKSKILLFKRQNNPLKNIYYTPGGRVNKNEHLNDAILRKSKEELGLDLKLKDLRYCGAIEEFFNNSNFEEVKNGTHHINFVYEFIMSNNININLDEQHESYKWFDINDDKLHHYIKDKINLCLK